MNHFNRENTAYINSLRSATGGVPSSMLTALCVPSKPKSGWIKHLAKAPFNLRTATKETIFAFWREDKKQKPERAAMRVYKLDTPVIRMEAPDDGKTPRISVCVHWDGGTPCNIPAKGYGIGYGSYRLDAGEVHRVSHGRPMSNNAAEIWTLCSALERIIDTYPTSHEAVKLLLQCDSQIALKWAVKSRKGQCPEKGSGEFVDSVKRLCELTPMFSSLRAEWKPRFHAVQAFGH